MDQPLDISDVIRRTGLTARALRFYEARGLVRPLRTASGRRLYGPGELQRINQVVTLKAAGFSLADIGGLLDRRSIDLGRLIAAQLEALDAQAARVADARALLMSAKSRVDRGEPLDAATLCSLIRTGDTKMATHQWQEVAGRYFTPEQQSRWAETLDQLPAEFSQEDYGARWSDLGTRIAAALPLDPAAPAAQGFVDEWFALLKPFTMVATPEMWNGTVRMYDDLGNWPEGSSPGFGKEVWDFIRTATKARLAAGGKVNGPAWMTGQQA